MTDPREPHLDAATPELETPATQARVPGAPRDGYTRMPTGPVGLAAVTTSGPEADAPWQPSSSGEPLDEDEPKLAPWALMAAIVALVASFFVGWGIPVAIVAVIAAIMSLRRPEESRALAWWSLALGVLATVFSAGWLVWAAFQLGWFG